MIEYKTAAPQPEFAVPTGNMYRQEEIAGKGRGLVATTTLLVGTVLITEQPLIVAEKADKTEIVAAFQRLSEEKKEQVLSLYDFGSALANQNEMEVKIIRIFCGNSIDLCAHEEMNINKSGLYPTISLVNHSCVPNVVWSWMLTDCSRRAKQVKVIRVIKEGEEILASYCGVGEIFPTKAERRIFLRFWQFTCQCKICSLTGDELKANDEARKKITNFHEDVTSFARAGLLTQSLEATKRKIKIMKSIKEEMILYIPSALMECCEMAAHCNKYKELNAEKLMKKAKEMSEQSGDCFVYNYQKKETKISKILRKK